MLVGKRCRLREAMQADRKYRTFQNTVRSETLPIQIFEFLSFEGTFLLLPERKKAESNGISE